MAAGNFNAASVVRWLSERRFKKRWLIPIFAGVLVAVVFGNRLEMLWALRTSTIEAALHRVADASGVIAASLPRALQAADLLLLRSANAAADGREGIADAEEGRAAFGIQLGKDSPLRILEFDARGRPVRSTSGVSPATAALLGRMAADLPRQGRQRDPLIGEWVRADASEPWLLPVSRPIVSANGAVRSGIVIGIDPGILLRQVIPGPMLAHGAAVIFQPDGRVLAHWPPERPLAGVPNGALAELGRSASAGNAATFDALRWDDGVERFTALRQVPGMSLWVMTGEGRAEALSDWRRAAVRFIAIMPFALSFVIWTCWFALRQMRLRDETLASVFQSEQRLRDVIDGSLQGIIVHRAGVPIFANRRAADILGYADAAELTGIDSLERTIAPEELPRLQSYAAARAEGRPAPDLYEFQGLRKDGRPYWAETRVRRIQWDAEPATLATLFDITERHEAKEQLLASQHLLQTAFDAVPHALSVKDRERRYLTVNQAMAERWGVPREAIIGRHFPRPDLEGSGELQTLESLDARVLEDGEHVDTVIPRTLPGGSQAMIRLVKVPWRDAAGAIVGIVTLAEDVTARYAAEDARRAGERLLHLVIDTLPHGIFVKDLEGRYLLMNHANARMFGMEPNQQVGMRIDDLPWPNPSDARALADADRRVIETHGTVEIPQWEFTQPDGRKQVRHMIKLPLFNDAGEIAGIVGITEDITARLESERALRESERRFKDFTEAASDWFWETDASLRYVSIVGRAYAIEIQDPAGVLGKTPWEVDFPPEDEVNRRTLRQRMESRQPVRGMVLQVYGHGGTVRSLRFNGIPILDAQGVFQGYRGTGTDMTEEIAARRAADVAHARLSDAIGALPAAFLLWDADERLVLWNERAVDFLPDIAGHLVPGLSLAEYAEFAGDAVAGPGTPERERWIQDRIALFRDPPPSREIQRLDGRRVRILERRTSEGGTVSVHLDVSEESHARNAAELAVARLTDAIEALPAAFLLWGADERLILRNNRALALFPDAADWMKTGIAFEAYVRHAVRSWGGDPAEDVEAFVQRRIEMFRNPPVSLELHRTDGRWVQIHEHRTSEGGVASMLFDITEQKSREQQLRQAQKMEAVGQLTAGVAHDFNNLLQVVLGYAMMVKRALGPHHAAGEMMEHIRAAGQRGADLTQQLLTFSRNQVMQAGRMNLNQTIANQVKMLERMVGERIELETRFDPRLEDLHGDRGMIGQAIMNLVINARDAMPSGGKIVVSTEALEADARFRDANVWAKPGPYAAIRCADNGCGMPPEVLARIFEPFFTTKKLGEGTGLGLAIVYGIAQQHGGMVSAQSEPGRGTTVTIFLPVYPPEGPAAPEERAAPQEGQSQTVLVAEDSDAVRELLRRVLTEHGYQVLAVPNGEQAVDEFSRHGDRIDLVLLDIVMPGMGGISARKQILQLRPGTRILFASGWSNKEDQASIRVEGVPFLRKPFSPQALLQAVHDVLHGGETVH